MLKQSLDSNFPLILLFLLIISLAMQQFFQTKINPNENYLEEIRELRKIIKIKKIKDERIKEIISFICGMIIYYIVIYLCEGLLSWQRTMILIISSLIILAYGIISTKSSLEYLKTKDDSNPTRKYLIYNFCFSILMFSLLIFICYIRA